MHLTEGHKELEKEERTHFRETDLQTSAQCTLMSTQGSGFQYSRAQVWTNQFLTERCNSEKEKQSRKGSNWVSSVAFIVGQAFTSKWRLKNSKTPIICLLLHKGINTLDVPLWNKSLPSSDSSYVYNTIGGNGVMDRPQIPFLYHLCYCFEELKY